MTPITEGSDARLDILARSLLKCAPFLFESATLFLSRRQRRKKLEIMNTTMHDKFSQRIGWLGGLAVRPPDVRSELSARVRSDSAYRFFDTTVLCTRDRRHHGGTAGEGRSGAHRG